MSDELATAIAVLFNEQSTPIRLDEVIPTEDRPPTTPLSQRPRRGRLLPTWTGPSLAAAVFVAVLLLGWLLAPDRGRNEDVQEQPTTVVPTTTTPAKTTMSTTIPTPPATVSYPPAPVTLASLPLVLHEVPRSRAPLFDTDSLGAETPLNPVLDLDVAALGLEDNEFPLDDSAVIVLGQVGDIIASQVPIVAFGAPHLCDWSVVVDRDTPSAVGSCAFEVEPRPDITIQIRSQPVTVAQSDLPEVTGSGEVTLGDRWVTHLYWSGHDDTVAAVGLRVGDEVALWQRPVGGVAVFVVETLDVPLFEMTAYDAAGRVVRTATRSLSEE